MNPKVAESVDEDVLTDWGEVLVISPHLDDALLSAYEIARRTGAEVWTVLAGDPDEPITTWWDRLCGFSDSHSAMIARRAEDAAACAAAGVRHRHFGGLDAMYTTPSRRARDLGHLQRNLLDWVQDRRDRTCTVVLPACAGIPILSRFVSPVLRVVWRPVPAFPTTPVPVTSRLRTFLGKAVRRAAGYEYRVRLALAGGGQGPNVNPDHLVVRDAALAVLADQPGPTVVLTEDLPYLWGAPADGQVAQIARRYGWSPTPMVLPVDKAAKCAVVSHYASQLAAVDPEGRLRTPEGVPGTERSWLMRAGTHQDEV